MRQGDGAAAKIHPVLRVGVTGHRPGPKLPDAVAPAVRATVARLFAVISDAAREGRRPSGRRRPLVVVSSLAEGADRIVAEAGLACGAALDVVLPAPRAFYERDFTTTASKATTARSWPTARSVVELEEPDGRVAMERGYEAAGLLMLDSSDLLITVWDEGPAAGIGGTGNIVERAARRGMPIVLVNPAAPGEARLLRPGAPDALRRPSRRRGAADRRRGSPPCPPWFRRHNRPSGARPSLNGGRARPRRRRSALLRRAEASAWLSRTHSSKSCTRCRSSRDCGAGPQTAFAAARIRRGERRGAGRRGGVQVRERDRDLTALVDPGRGWLGSGACGAARRRGGDRRSDRSARMTVSDDLTARLCAPRLMAEMTFLMRFQDMTPRIVFVVFPGFELLDLSGPLAVFADANSVAGCDYDLRVVSDAGGLVVSSTVVAVSTEKADASAPLDTLIVVGGPLETVRTPDGETLALIIRLAARARRVASVCTGAFLLASAGLLMGRRATTHWKFAAELQARAPDTRVDADAIFITDGRIWSSAGVTAGIDLALALVEEDRGQEISRTVARGMVVYHRRLGGQSQYSALLDMEPPSDRVRRVLSFMREHLHEPLPVSRLAEAARLSDRQFARIFRAETGVSPAKSVERLRAEAARPIVEGTAQPMGSIAESVGFADAKRMNQAFIRAFGQTPQALRRNHRAAPLARGSIEAAAITHDGDGEGDRGESRHRRHVAPDRHRTFAAHQDVAGGADVVGQRNGLPDRLRPPAACH